MAISLTLNYSDEWAARLLPVINKLSLDMNYHPVVQNLLQQYNKTHVEDLTPKQRAKLVIHFYFLTQLNRYEAEQAEIAARATVNADVEENFPVEVE